MPVTLSTDDTTVSDITLSEEYRRAVDEIGLTLPELWAIDRHALDVAFADEADLAPLRDGFDAWAASACRILRTACYIPRVNCPACGTPSEPGRKFCAECGARLVGRLPVVRRRRTPRHRASAANAAAGSTPSRGGRHAPARHSRRPPRPSPSPPVAERRLVTVLFADLVGFTALAEGRDAEAVRELLTRYFELARDVIERYGGTVEKFIGDAVMAVWGAPVAHEDDAERGVRAGLELVDAVRTLGPDVQARAGVLTGEAAVTLGARDQGMVAGDLVNTAVATPVGRRSRHGAGRRGDAPRRVRRDRLRAGRRPGPQGQGGARSPPGSRCGS